MRNVVTTPRKGMRYPSGSGAPSKMSQRVNVGESASRFLNRKIKMKTVSAIGSVTRNPVRKTLRIRRFRLFIKVYLGKSSRETESVDAVVQVEPAPRPEIIIEGYRWKASRTAKWSEASLDLA